jgi:oxygen-independent coproporphyrinogen-3 oxidase
MSGPENHRTEEPTEVGSVFISNYPPYSFWDPSQVEGVHEALAAPPRSDATLGLYLHIPFCRRRCKFCYFKVYTDKDNAQVKRYLAAMAREVEMYAEQAAVAGRPLEFVYFGGGTPSYISSRDLTELATRVQAALPWTGAREIAFECEPGTLTPAKLEVIRSIGVTRLSLGVESFDDGILQENGRAHLSEETDRCLPWVREAGFEQLNIDLIAGMVGETWDTWKKSVSRTLEIAPDSVTIYQMELPYNTVYSQDVQGGGLEQALADWRAKREWHDWAFQQFEDAGYEISSAYTVVKKDRDAGFVYRDAVWHGTDMIGAGVASFGHMSGVHVQNHPGWEDYLTRTESGELPLDRAFRTTPEQRLTRELILQLKLGRLDAEYFRKKFRTDILEQYGEAFQRLESRRMLTTKGGKVRLSREGLLRVDQLLPEFYHPEHRNARYT